MIDPYLEAVVESNQFYHGRSRNAGKVILDQSKRDPSAGERKRDGTSSKYYRLVYLMLLAGNDGNYRTWQRYPPSPDCRLCSDTGTSN